MASNDVDKQLTSDIEFIKSFTKRIHKISWKENNKGPVQYTLEGTFKKDFTVKVALNSFELQLYNEDNFIFHSEGHQEAIRELFNTIKLFLRQNKLNRILDLLKDQTDMGEK